ncbi:MAG: PKD-like domain-containing protein, partial [Saprospiraceae bacterium]
MWRNLRALLILSALCFSHFAWAQPANDPCSSAINVTNLAGGCTTYDFTGATSDLANGSCTSAPTNPNIWFTFTAQGPDVTIVAKSGADNFEVTIVEFAPTPCVFANATEVACSVSPLNSTSLVAGTQYYVIISFPNNSVTSFQLCITNPVPPPIPANDSPCFPVVATPNGPCVNGTTVAATGDFANPACAPNFPSNSVWYTVALTGVNNVVNVSFANENITGDVSIMVGYFTGGCNGQFFLLNNGEYCGPPPTPGSPFSVTGIAGTTYYIQVGSSDAGAGTFAMCVTQNGPPPGCSGNDLCSNAAPFPALITSAAPICLTGCNIGAGPENTGLAGCYDFSSAPGIWYTFTTDANAANINMVLNSTVPGEIQNPQVALFSGSCAGLVPVTCNTGSMGNLSMVQVAVSPNTTYYVLVGNVSGNPGHFSLCLAATANTNVCVISSAFTVTSTSLGSPLAGPYLPGELVSFKFRINSFQVDPIGQGNNCQWLQAMVPIFGDCWDPTSFSADGEPITHTGPNPVYGAVWDWFPEGDVDYNFNSPYLKLFIDPNTGRLVLCHYLDPSCTSPGISGGDGLPAGWYAYRGTPDPDVTYGDGAGCGTTNGPYEVNFTLRTRNYDGPEGCSETGFHDCDVVMYTFADGETGSWSGSSSVCAQDQPKFLNRELNCCEGPTIDPIEKTICSGSSTAIEITSNQDPDVDYTFTVVPNGGVTGEASGTGKFLNQILINTTTTVKTVIWYVSGKKDGCTGQVEEIRVTVLPQLKAKITASPDTTGCAQSIFTLTANFTNNPSPPTSYLWSNNSTDPSIIVQPNLSTTFTVTVTDANGCSAVDDVTILIRPLFDVDVANNGDTIRCQEARPFLTITANPLGGAAPYTSYIWDTPIGNASGKSQVISTPNQTGLYTVTVTDKFGCTGTGTINVEIFPTPFINTDPFPDTICQGQGQLTMFGFIGVPGSVYWDNSGNNLVLYSSDEGDGNLRIFTNLIPAGNYNPIFIGESEDGCKDSIPMPFVVVAKPNLSLTPIDTLCAGTLPVPLIAAPSGGTWTGTGVVGNTFDPKIAGTGTFKLYYVFGACNAKDSMSVTVKTLPVVSVTLPGTGLYCKDQPMVIASALPTGGVWSGDIGANGEIDPITLMAGNYLVSYSYTDTKGCSNVDTDQYTIKPQITPAITGQLSFCNSLSTNLTGQGGFAGYTWTKPDSTTFSGSTIPANLPGVYNLTVTDAQGCTGTFAVNVVEYPEANPVISGSLTFCTGNYTTIGVENGYVNYIWSNTEATAAIDVTIPGPYSVTITDNNGCKDSVSTIVSEASELTPVIGGLYEYCSGKSTVLDVGTGFTQMNWTTPVGTATGQMITAAIPGTYTVMVTDASGCTGDTTITVAENSLPVPVIAGAASICTGASTILNATNPNYVQYNWTLPGGGAGPNTPTIAANLAGSYVVTVTDTKGCVGTDNFDIAIVP